MLFGSSQDKRFVLVSQLSLCDLAGSERTKRTENDGDRLKEAGAFCNSVFIISFLLFSLIRPGHKTFRREQ